MKASTCVIMTSFAAMNLTITNSVFAQSAGDFLMANRTPIVFVLTSITTSSNAQVTASSGNTTDPNVLPANTDKDTIHVEGPIRQNITVNFSYRDQATRSYGCDYTMFLNFLRTTAEDIDHYYQNFGAYTATNPQGVSVTCAAQTGTQYTTSGFSGANMDGVFFIRPR